MNLGSRTNVESRHSTASSSIPIEGGLVLSGKGQPAFDYPVETEPQTNYFPTTTHEGRGVDLSSIAPIEVPAVEIGRAHFQPMAQWEGAVIEVFDSYFSAQVIDLKSDDVSIVEFNMDDVSEFDRPLCRPGGLFFWTIGRETKPSGQVKNSSVIRFRRLGKAHRS